MGKIISFANQKGGVGKSTSAINIAAALGQMGKKTLLVDLDPQGNTTSGVGINKKQIKTSSYDVLIARADVQSAITNTAFTNLDILPSNITLAGAEFELVDTENRESRLKMALDKIKDIYDYIIIDCPPSLGLLTLNALGASNGVVVPMLCAYFPHDSRGNVREGPCTVVESDGNICVARSARISLLGVKNLVVVTTPDAVLVADKSRISEMKKLIKR